jgi:hypothetical protein
MLNFQMLSLGALSSSSLYYTISSFSQTPFKHNITHKALSTSNASLDTIVRTIVLFFTVSYRWLQLPVTTERPTGLTRAVTLQIIVLALIYSSWVRHVPAPNPNPGKRVGSG